MLFPFVPLKCLDSYIICWDEDYDFKQSERISPVYLYSLRRLLLV